MNGGSPNQYTSDSNVFGRYNEPECCRLLNQIMFNKYANLLCKLSLYNSCENINTFWKLTPKY